MLKACALVSSLSTPLLVAGCMSLPPGETAVTPGTSVASWQMPWQLDPIWPQSVAHGETTTRTYVPGTGYVRGTPTALASVGRPLPKGPEPNHTVETCRQTVAGEAAKFGARQVEAASAGRESIDAKGNYVAPVLIRVNYLRGGHYEVREAVMTCIVDRNEKIVDAYAAGSRHRVEIDAGKADG